MIQKGTSYYCLTLSLIAFIQKSLSRTPTPTDISFGFHTPTPNDDEASLYLPSSVTMTLFWESSKYQCTVTPDTLHANYSCSTSDTDQTHSCITDETFWHSLEIDVESPEENTSIAIDEIFIHQTSENHVVHLFCDEQEVGGCFRTLSIENHNHMLFNIEEYNDGSIENGQEYAKYVNRDEVEDCDEIILSSTVYPTPTMTASPQSAGDTSTITEAMNVWIVWVIVFVVCCIIPMVIGCVICGSLYKREELMKRREAKIRRHASITSNATSQLGAVSGYKYSKDMMDGDNDEADDVITMEQQMPRLPPSPKRMCSIADKNDAGYKCSDFNENNEYNQRKATFGRESEEEMKSGIIASGMKAATMTAGGPIMDEYKYNKVVIDMTEDDLKMEDNKEECWEEVQGEKDKVNHNKIPSLELKFNVSVSASAVEEGNDKENNKDDGSEVNDSKSTEVTELEIDSLMVQRRSLSPTNPFITSTTDNIKGGEIKGDIEPSDDHQFALYLNAIGGAKYDESDVLEDTGTASQYFEVDDAPLDGLNINGRTLEKLGETDLFGFGKGGDNDAKDGDETITNEKQYFD